MTSLDTLRREVFEKRRALDASLGETKQRLRPSQLVGDMLNVVDPQLVRLEIMKNRVTSRPLLSLAVLAGLGWIFGASVRPRVKTGTSRAARGDPNSKLTPKPAKQKENENDSGQRHGNGRTDATVRRAKEPLDPLQPAGEAEGVLPRIGGEAQQEHQRPQFSQREEERAL